MAGSDHTRPGVRGVPTVVLVDPQLGENIGTAARAMLNFGLTDLRLVRPRDGWPNAKAVSAAAGATEVLDKVRIFETTAAAVTDLHRLFAATARPRSMLKPTVTACQAAVDMRGRFAAGEACGVIFGPERTGLNNDDVARADAILTIPINPRYASLNLAQTVVVIAYEWFQTAQAPVAEREACEPSESATQAELENFYDHLMRELDECGFLFPPEKRPAMVRNIRNIFQRAGLHAHEVRTLHGIVTELSAPRRLSADPDVDDGTG